MLKEKASSTFKIVFEDHNDDEDDVSMQRIANRIIEIKKITKRRTEYNIINTEKLFDGCSSTLITFLSKLSCGFEKSLNAAMIGAIVTSTLTNSFGQLQLALGILIESHEKGEGF